MNPIKIFIYKETRAPKKGEWYWHVGFEAFTMTNTNLTVICDIYECHTVRVPKWAVSVEPVFSDGKGYRTSVIDILPIPPKKRCRWRGGYDGVTVETVDKFTRTEIETIMRTGLEFWRPIDEEPT